MKINYRFVGIILAAVVLLTLGAIAGHRAYSTQRLEKEFPFEKSFYAGGREDTSSSFSMLPDSTILVLRNPKDSLMLKLNLDQNAEVAFRSGEKSLGVLKFRWPH